jgi:hypothetical protein
MTRHDADDETTPQGRPDARGRAHEAVPPAALPRPKSTLPGIAPPPIDAHAVPPAVAVVAARVVGVAEPDLAAPTDPDGHPRLARRDTDPDVAPPWTDAASTGPTRSPKPAVPPPDAPSIEVSQSLLLESAQVEAAVQAARQKARDAKERPRRAAEGGPEAGEPTYEMLPALKRKRAQRESSDWPLIVGLTLLALIIAALVGTGAYMVVRSMNAPPPAPAAR